MSFGGSKQKKLIIWARSSLRRMESVEALLGSDSNINLVQTALNSGGAPKNTFLFWSMPILLDDEVTSWGIDEITYQI
jgi:hypothetical protein